MSGTRWQPKLIFFAGAVFLTALVSLISLSAAPPSGTDDGYADSHTCASCHRQIAEDYSRTGMGRSFFRPAPANIIEDFTKRNEFYHSLSDTHFSMTVRDGRYYQRRWQIGFDGKETNVEEARVDYVMGSGNHARSYLHRTARNTLIELPLGWYPVNGGAWNMVPSSDSDHPRTRRYISYKCMFCHNGIPRIPAGNKVPGSDPVYPADLPEGIDCQRCHGPGARHVKTAETAGARLADIRASIANPARLNSTLQMEVCYQCHLETSSGPIPASLTRFDRGPFSFRPGERLGDFQIAFDHAPGTGHDGKFEAVSSVYRLRQSQCFLRSEGKLTCETCHNPHRIPRGEEAVRHYSAVCRQCHGGSLDTLISSGKHPSDANCVACHMPKRRAEDTPRMVMTDHLIQRRPPSRDLLAEFPERPAEVYRGEVVPYYPSPLPSTGENALYRAVAQVGLANNLEAGLPELKREIDRQKPREAEFYIVLGDGLRGAGKPAEAVAPYEQAVRLNPNSARALRSLAMALDAAGRKSLARDAFGRAIQAAPDDPESWYRFGVFDSESGQTDEAVEKIRKAIALDPSAPDRSRILADILVKAGRAAPAQAALLDALRINPYDDAAWDLSGRVETGKGELPEAFYDFQKAIRLRAGYGPHLFDYALALIRADRFDDAQEQAEAAVRADPKLAGAHEVLGGLFARKKRFPEAAREYRILLNLQPDLSRAHFRLGEVLAAQGDAVSAAGHLREAAQGSDPAIARQAALALRQLRVQ